jgi:hypothetical protein
MHTTIYQVTFTRATEQQPQEFLRALPLLHCLALRQNRAEVAEVVVHNLQPVHSDLRLQSLRGFLQTSCKQTQATTQ